MLSLGLDKKNLISNIICSTCTVNSEIYMALESELQSHEWKMTTISVIPLTWTGQDHQMSKLHHTETAGGTFFLKQN